MRADSEWLGKLYNCLYPPHLCLGSPHLLSDDTLSELSQNRITTSVQWVKDLLNHGNPSHGVPPVVTFVSNLMRSSNLAMLLNCHPYAKTTIQLGQVSRLISQVLPRYRTPSSLIRTTSKGSACYVVYDLMAMMRCDSPEAIDRGVCFLK